MRCALGGRGVRTCRWSTDPEDEALLGIAHSGHRIRRRQPDLAFAIAALIFRCTAVQLYSY